MKYKLDMVELWFKRKYWKLIYGFDISETWSLDYSLAKWLVVRLKWFAKHTQSYPTTFTSYEMWLEYLTEIIDGIEFYLKTQDEFNSLEDEAEGYRRLIKSMKLFNDKLTDMWD